MTNSPALLWLFFLSRPLVPNSTWTIKRSFCPMSAKTSQAPSSHMTECSRVISSCLLYEVTCVSTKAELPCWLISPHHACPSSSSFKRVLQTVCFSLALIVHNGGGSFIVCIMFKRLLCKICRDKIRVLEAYTPIESIGSSFLNKPVEGCHVRMSNYSCEILIFKCTLATEIPHAPS